MRLIDIDKLRGCAIIRPMSHEEMSHILSCRNILTHDEIPTAYNKKYDKEIRDKAIEEFTDQIEKRFLGVNPELCYVYTPNGIVDICKDIAKQMKEVEQ